MTEIILQANIATKANGDPKITPKQDAHEVTFVVYNTDNTKVSLDLLGNNIETIWIITPLKNK